MAELTGGSVLALLWHLDVAKSAISSLARKLYGTAQIEHRSIRFTAEKPRYSTGNSPMCGKLCVVSAVRQAADPLV